MIKQLDESSTKKVDVDLTTHMYEEINGLDKIIEIK